jgi:gluconate kinase
LVFGFGPHLALRCAILRYAYREPLREAMGRREFIMLLSSATASWPLASRAKHYSAGV